MPYRDENDIEGLASQCTELEKRLLEARRQLHAAQQGRSLPLLDDIRVASPCPASWDNMVGDHRVRFCPGCDKNVYNLSAMTRAQGEALIREKEGRLCARFYRRADGTVLTADCKVGVRRKRIRRVFAVAVSASLFSGIYLSMQPAQPEQKAPCPVGAARMGGIALSPGQLGALTTGLIGSERGSPGLRVTVDPNEVPSALH